MCQYGAWPAAFIIKAMVVPFGLLRVEEVTFTYFSRHANNISLAYTGRHPS